MRYIFLLMGYIDSWKSELCSVGTKGNDQIGRFPNNPNLGIGEAERIRFRNADELVDYSDQ